MKYLIYDTEADAQAAQDTIFGAGAQIAQARGYTVDQQGIVGNRNNAPDINAGRTSRWSSPVQRQDGKWIIRHPESHPVAIETPALLQPIMNALGSVTVEEYQDTWFDDGSSL